MIPLSDSVHSGYLSRDHARPLRDYTSLEHISMPQVRGLVDATSNEADVARERDDIDRAMAAVSVHVK